MIYIDYCVLQIEFIGLAGTIIFQNYLFLCAGNLHYKFLKHSRNVCLSTELIYFAWVNGVIYKRWDTELRLTDVFRIFEIN